MMKIFTILFLGKCVCKVASTYLMFRVNREKKESNYKIESVEVIHRMMLTEKKYTLVFLFHLFFLHSIFHLFSSLICSNSRSLDLWLIDSQEKKCKEQDVKCERGGKVSEMHGIHY